MQFSQSLDLTLPIELALMKAARSAMTTVILAEGKELDLSRLSLLGVSIKLKGEFCDNPTVRATFTKSIEGESGQHYSALISYEKDANEFACLEFCILDRKRGLSTDLLTKLQEATDPVISKNSPKSIDLENIYEKYPNLREKNEFSGIWPLEAIFLACLDGRTLTQAPNIPVNFKIFAVADSNLGCLVHSHPEPAVMPFKADLTQDGQLIAQLN